MPLPSTKIEDRGSRQRRAARATGVAARLAGALGLLALLACDPYVQGNGKYAEEARSVAPFHGVAVEDGLVASVTSGGDAFSVLVSGDENVVRHVETRLDGSVLLVRMEDDIGYDSLHPMRVAIVAPAIDVLRAAAEAAIVATGIAAESLVVEAGDGADVRISGSGGATLHATLRGGGPRRAHLDARGYPVESAVVDLADGAVAQLSVKGEIGGSARGSEIENFGAGRCAVELRDGATCRTPRG